MSRPRSLAVVIPTLDGQCRLEECLASLARSAPPGLPWRPVVFDNGSAGDLGAWLAHRHPDVLVLRSDVNLGFAAAIDRAAEGIEDDLLCLLNDDMRVAPDFLGLLVSAHESLGGCVGGRIVDWAGDSIEFDGGLMSLSGHAAPLRHGAATRAWPPGEPHRTLFCSGGAMVVERRRFLEIGGFDPDYFAYFEDVDFGWRSHVLGEDCWHVPAAVAYHREHGTEGALPAGRRLALLERNALATLYKNLEPERGERVLRYALALVGERARLEPTRAAACAEGLTRFAAGLPELERRRRELTALRRRSDAEIAPLFVDPWHPAIGGAEYCARQRELAGLFVADDLFAGDDGERGSGTPPARGAGVDAGAGPSTGAGLPSSASAVSDSSNARRAGVGVGGGA